MKAQPIVRIAGMILLSVVVSIIVLALVYALQQPNLMVTHAIGSWNP